MRVAVIVACSGGKSLPPFSRFKDMPDGVTPELWLSTFAGAPLTPARLLYTGAVFKKMRSLVSQIGADLWIASAGLGLVGEHELVPGYGCTFGPGVDSVSLRYANNIAEWFVQLSSVRKVDFSSYKKVFAVVPDSYESGVLSLLGDRVHFITTHKGLPSATVYDRRINDRSRPYAGNVVSYKQRCFHHFIENVYPACPEQPDLTLYTDPGYIKREKVTDTFLLEWLRRQRFPSIIQAVSAAHRQGIAVQPPRIARLWKQL